MATVLQALRAKFIHGERHTAEYAARIIVLNRCAFFFRDAVFAALNQQLCGANQTNHREKSQRNGQIAACAVIVIVKHQGLAQRRKHRVGKVVFLAATAAVAVAIGHLFNDLGIQDHGADNLHVCRGKIVLAAYRLRECAKIVAGLAFEKE